MDFLENKNPLMAFMAHAVAEYPKEAVGYIDQTYQYVPLVNTSKTPMESFSLPKKVSLEVQKKAIAVLHSHTNGNKAPSAKDIEACAASGLPWAISLVNETTEGITVNTPLFWGDGVPDIPLKGRQWRSGPSGTDGRGDCYALVRDFYKQELGIELKEFGRDEMDFKNGHSLFDDNFKKAGFHPIPINEARRGDVLLMKIRCDVPNHCGVMVDDQILLQHLQNRLSGEDIASRWAQVTVKTLRYADK